MAEDGDRTALMSAITTEHFVMQTALSSAVSEQQARAAMYIYSLSSALVAMGFMVASPNLMLFVAAVLPVILVVGLLTTLRLIDIGMESLQSHVTIARMRAYYRDLGPEAEDLFRADRGRWPEGSNQPSLAAGAVLGILTTAASMIACVNAFVAGTGVTLLLNRLAGLGFAVSAGAGALCGVGLVLAFHLYQHFRLARMSQLSEVEKVAHADD